MATQLRNATDTTIASTAANWVKQPRVIAPGVPMTVFSANCGTVGHQILEQIAQPGKCQPESRREFGEWQDGVCSGRIFRPADECWIDVELKLNVEEGVVLVQGDDVGSWSNKPTRSFGSGPSGTYHLSIGAKAFKLQTGDDSDSRLARIANLIVGTWVGHGFGWTSTDESPRPGCPHAVANQFLEFEAPWGVFEGTRDPYLNGAPKTTRRGFAGLEDFQESPTPASVSLGTVVPRDDVVSTLSGFLVSRDYQTQYPPRVNEALVSLYGEYNAAFSALVAANREHGTDYQCCTGVDGSTINGWVQIDMIGLSPEFLQHAANAPVDTVKEELRLRIFEIENSLAMYQLLGRAFLFEGSKSRFDRCFRQSLDEVRQRHGRPVALLAVTDEKFRSMRGSEFGVTEESPVPDDTVAALSGFDRFFGPKDFARYLESFGGACEYLLYVRSSDPVSKLRNPREPVNHPLLGDNEIRRIIRANALTINVDTPGTSRSERINDTKAYMSSMGMGFAADSLDDLLPGDYLRHLGSGRSPHTWNGSVITESFASFVESQGLSSEDVGRGRLAVRCKPMVGAYGCYGHLTGSLTEARMRRGLTDNLRERGAYVVQPELTESLLADADSGRTYTYIDRVFLSTNGDNYISLGGFRSLMPTDSIEARKRRNHGNAQTVWTEIL